jgi:hypothetical protein
MRKRLTSTLPETAWKISIKMCGSDEMPKTEIRSGRLGEKSGISLTLDIRDCFRTAGWTPAVSRARA